MKYMEDNNVYDLGYCIICGEYRELPKDCDICIDCMGVETDEN